MRQTRTVDDADRNGEKAPAAVRTVARALDVLLAFSPADHDLSAREISERVGLHRSTAHRLASYLATRGFLSQHPLTLRYRLGLRLVELGSLALRQTTLRNTARPYLESLANSTGETVFLAVLDRHEAVHLDVIDSSRPGLFLTTQPGRRVPLHSSSTGKVLLAWLPESQVRRIIASTGLPSFTQATLTSPDRLLADLASVRTHGYGMDNEETQEGAVGVAAPIIDSTGAVVAALSLAGPPVRIRSQVDQLVGNVKLAAAGISTQLGHASQAEWAGAV